MTDDEIKKLARQRGWSIRDNDWYEELRSLRVALLVLGVPAIAILIFEKFVS